MTDHAQRKRDQCQVHAWSAGAAHSTYHQMTRLDDGPRMRSFWLPCACRPVSSPCLSAAEQKKYRQSLTIAQHAAVTQKDRAHGKKEHRQLGSAT